MHAGGFHARCGVPYAAKSGPAEIGGQKKMTDSALGANSRLVITTSAVTVVVNGSIVPSAAPARIFAGRVVAPLTPIVVRLASRAAYEAAAARIVVERDGVRIVVPVVFVEHDMPFAALGPLVRAIGGSAVFDTATKTLSIDLPPAPQIATPPPYDPGAPRVEPTTVFTLAPPPPTPRAVETGLPRPRRTAIPVLPSQPVAPPSAEPTDQRR
jgi:hypothetical protein